MTGPAATVADLTAAGEQDRVRIELAITILLFIILVIIYRNLVTMLLPLITIGMSLVVAQAVVAGLSVYSGLAISNQTIIFLSGMMAGAGTDYAVFLISRYHDYLRQGAQFGSMAVKRALTSIGKVIAASAATVGDHLPRDELRQVGGVLDGRSGIGGGDRRGVPCRGDTAAGHHGARRAAVAGSQPRRELTGSLLAAVGHPHRAQAQALSGRQRDGADYRWPAASAWFGSTTTTAKPCRHPSRAPSDMPRWSGISR